MRIVLWCNGSTTGFGSVCPGSNPGRTTKKSVSFETDFFVVYCSFRIIKIFFCRTFKDLGKIFAGLPTCLGKVHQQMITTVTRGRSGNVTLIRSYKSESLLHQRQDIGRGEVTFYNQVVACKAAHRPPIHNVARPQGMIAQEGRRKVLHSMYGTRAERRLAVGLFHTHIECRYNFAADSVLARHIYATFQADVVYCKTRNLFHTVKGLKGNVG